MDFGLWGCILFFIYFFIYTIFVYKKNKDFFSVDIIL